jgi:ArsR family transcriptional regulator
MAVPLYQAKADLLRVLGHPARIRVLELLAEGDLAAGELLAEIPIEAGSLSQQLAVLRRAGLVGHRREAGTVVYSLTVPEVRHVLVAARTVLAALPAEGEVVGVDLRAGSVASHAGPPVGVVATAVARRSLAG